MSTFNRFRKYSKNGKGGTTEVELPLAPMASVFTVILVFLIKSASLNASTLAPATDVSLPELTTASAIPDAVKVEVSTHSILVADKVVLDLDHFVPSIARNPSSEGEDPFARLKSAIEFERGEGKLDQNAPLVIIADKAAPYQLLKQVMGAAAGAGFLALKLVVISGGE
jgi:biopolymer transport protein ExbD